MGAPQALESATPGQVTGLPWMCRFTAVTFGFLNYKMGLKIPLPDCFQGLKRQLEKNSAITVPGTPLPYCHFIFIN